MDGRDRPQVHQHVCTECGKPFTTAGKQGVTCSHSCRTMRSRRRKAQGDKFSHYKLDPGSVQQKVDQAAKLALDRLPEIAREVLAEELRPAVREHLTGQVLTSIADMLNLIPLAQQALREDLEAWDPIYDDKGEVLLDEDGQPHRKVNRDARARATSLVMKYTVGQPGLAPQPDTPDAAPIVINFASMPGLPSHIDGDAHEDIELLPGQRVCDICSLAKDPDEFSGMSSRCLACHAANTERVLAAIEERAGGKK